MKSSDDAPSCMIHIFLSYIYPTLQSTSILYFLELQHYPTLLFNYSAIIRIIQNPGLTYFTNLSRKLRISTLALLTPTALVVISLPVARELIYKYLLYFLQSLLILFKFNATIILETSQISNMLNTMYFLFHITN